MKTVNRFFALLMILCLCGTSSVYARDIYSDTWVGNDGLGREIPTYTSAGPVRKDRYVGIFYFLFLDSTTGGNINDLSKAYLKGGVEGCWEALVQEGVHFWSEPYFGYYQNQDEWVYRAHAKLLSDAGVDFIFLDNTNNGGMFKEAWKTLFRVWSEVREEGGSTPQIIFHCGMDADTTANNIKVYWNELYRDGKYKDLWFYWDGKPLILGDDELLADEYIDFFTIRKSWAFNGWTGDGIGRWPWIAEYPQVPGRNAEGEIEQMVVSSGFHSNSSRGRSFSNDKEPYNGKSDFGFSLETTDLGLAFSEQWKEAIRVDPPLVMVTGWNEFTMGRWEDAGPGQYIAGTYTILENDPQFRSNYIDCFNVEYSRDIEPIRGFFKDNYYYLLTKYIRMYKGVRDIPEGSGNMAVDMSGDLSEFSDVSQTYYDTINDITHRDHTSSAGVYQYTNDTGRNDITEAKLSRKDGYTYFYVKCASDISEADGENWMNLFIDSDQNFKTGWEGFDYIINRSHKDGKVSIERFRDTHWTFDTVGEAEYTLKNDTMVIKVKDTLAGISQGSFDFKWADNSTVSGDAMEFMDLGDAAPNSRFEYRYMEKGSRDKDYIAVFITCGVFLVGIVLAGLKIKSIKSKIKNTEKTAG